MKDHLICLGNAYLASKIPYVGRKWGLRSQPFIKQTSFKHSVFSLLPYHPFSANSPIFLSVWCVNFLNHFGILQGQWHIFYSLENLTHYTCVHIHTLWIFYLYILNISCSFGHLLTLFTVSFYHIEGFPSPLMWFSIQSLTGLWVLYLSCQEYIYLVFSSNNFNSFSEIIHLVLSLYLLWDRD